jgi:hypothetical protein
MHGVVRGNINATRCQTIGELIARIREYDRKLEAAAEELYPETRLLR